MKVLILAGGRGSRLAEETQLRPKPLVEVGGKPILWHIMKIYSGHGYKDFVVACGYKGELIKDYFLNFFVHNSDLLINLGNGARNVINKNGTDWQIRVIDTGMDTMTGGRLLRLQNIIGDETFMVTYGDGVGNVDISALIRFHRAHGKLATVTAAHPPPRFGALSLDDDRVRSFSEKPQSNNAWINAGFFVFEPGVMEYIPDDSTVLERQPLQRLADDGQLMAFRHDSFWQPMDTLRDKELLEAHWASGKAPWKQWQ